MATIRTAIELEDHFSNILNNIVSAVNMTVSVMTEMQSAVNTPVEPAVFDGLRDYANQATMAVQELDAVLQNMAQPELAAPVLAQPKPVSAFIQWQSDNMNVFTDTGIERFQQELNSANYMLNALYNTQAQVAAAAANIDWLPDNVLTDLGNMQNRLQAIWQQVNLIGSNPLNFGSDVANAELERLRWQLNQAVQQQERLNAAVDNMDVQAANAAYLQLSQTVSGLEGYIRDNVDAQGEFNQTIHEGVSSAANLGGMLAGAVKTYLGLAGLRKAVDFGRSSLSAFDVQMNAEVQLATVASNMGMADYYDQILEQAAAIQGRGIYGDEIMIAGAAELATYFTDGDAVLSMMDTLTNYAAGMSGGGELSAQQMTDYATGLGKVMTGSYDAMSEKGFVFSDVQRAIIEGTASQAMIAAQLGAEYANMSADMQAAAAITQVIDEYWVGLYDTMSATPEGQIVQMLHTWGEMQEVIGGQLYPYVLLFVDTINANWPTIANIVQIITGGFQFMLGMLNWLLQAAIAVGGGIAENWDLLAPLIYGAAGALAVYGAALALTKGLELASIAAKIGHYLALYAQAAATGAAVSATDADAAAQRGLNTAILSCPVFWIIAGIVALVAVFYLAIAAVNHFAGTSISATGLICGAIAAAGAFIGNIFMAGLELILGVFATLYNTVAMFANFFGNVFNDPVSAVAHLFFDLVDNILSMLQSLASAIDIIFGAGLADKVQGWRDNLSVWVDDKFGAQVEIMGKFNTADFLSDYRFGYANAFNAGYNWGDNLKLFNVGNIPSPEDFANSLASGEIGGSLNDIANSAGAMANSLAMTDEDLKYMRDIAERETVNRFTTAEIVVNMGGITNQVNKMDDLDGIVEYLTNGINQAVEAGAEGVHI